jgi:hypothetical protein
VESKQLTKCLHNDGERAITGTWVTVEVNEAINENGYKLLKVFQVWHYAESEMYNPETKKGGIFTEYLNMAIKVKQEASGFPENCETEQQKQAYIADYESKEGKNKIIFSDKKNIFLIN